MNKKKLESFMKLNGDTQETLATAIGISRTQLNAKINERNATFMQPEIARIKERYNLSAKQIEEIFFSNLVS